MAACIHGEVCREYLRQHKGIICRTCPTGCRFYEPKRERTCRNTSEAVVKGPFTCSACGEHSKTWYHMGFGDMYADVPNFCPNCGARVVRDA